MSLKYLASGFFVKLLAGFDDTMTRLPIMANLTKTKKGRIAFASGIFIAICLVIGFAYLFASGIKAIPYAHYISSGLIFLLAIAIYFDIFIQKPKKGIAKKVQNVQRVSTKRFFKLAGIGFLVAFATIIDDTIAYSGLFLSTASNSLYVIGGIFLGTIVQLSALIFFSRKIQNIKFKKEITTIALLVLSALIFFKVL